MATTIETLFGIDEVKQSRDILNQKEDLGFGALMPQGYGAIGAAFSKLGRNTIGQGGMFGSNDPALKERASIEGALLETQNELTSEEMGDPAKLYPTMIAKLKNLNVNPKMILGLQQIMQDQIATKSTAEYNNAYKLATVNAAKNEAETKKLENERKLVEKKNTTLIKSFKTPIDEGHRLVTDYISQAFPDLDGKPQRDLFNKIQNDAGELYINGDISLSQAIATAGADLKDKYDFENKWFKSDKLTPKEVVSTDTSINTDLLNEKLKNYQPKTGN